MTQFKSKEKYQEWKNSLTAERKNKSKVTQQVTPPDATPPSSNRIAIRTFLCIVIVIILGVVGYFSYIAYEQRKTQQALKADLQVVVQKFRELKSGLSVGLNKPSYNDKLVTIRIELDKFENTHKGMLKEQLVNAVMLLEQAFQTYSDGKEAWGEDYNISLTNWKGDYFRWAVDTLQKYPLLKEKIRKHDYESEGSTYIIQEIYRSDYKDVIWAYADSYVQKAEALMSN